MRLIVMGVSGCGKSTVAHALAERLGLHMVDGDDLHLPGSVAKMRAGIALEDADRWPWLEAIGARIDAERAAGMGVVVSCSALKHVYRDCLRKKVNGRVRFILLDGPRDLISQRMIGRKGHFMPQSLLDSQLATLEKPGPDEDAVILDISQTVPNLLVKAAQSVGLQS